MRSMLSKVLAQDTMVRELLRPLFRFLSEPGATEIADQLLRRGLCRGGGGLDTV